MTYVINPASGAVSLKLNNNEDNLSLVYGNAVNASASSSTGQTVTLYRNGTDVTSENNVNKVLGVGYYNYTAVASENENYTATSATRWLNVTKFVSQLSFSLDKTSPQIYGTAINASCNLVAGAETPKLYRNGIDVTSSENNQNVTLGVGTYNYECNITGNENYTSISNSTTFTINKATPVLTFLANSGTSNLSLIYPAQVNMSVSSNIAGLTINLERDGASVLSENNQNVTLGVGSYLYRANITGNANYSDVGYSYYNVTIGKATPVLTKALNGVDNNLTITYGTAINATASSNAGTVSIFRNGSLINNGENYTLGAGYYEYKFNVTGNANYSDVADTYLYANVSKANSIVYLYLNSSRGNLTLAQLDVAFANATLIAGEGLLTLMGGAALHMGGTTGYNSISAQIISSELGTYLINASHAETENYTASSESFYVRVIDNVAPVVDYLPQTDNNGTISDEVLNVKVFVNERNYNPGAAVLNVYSGAGALVYSEVKALGFSRSPAFVVEGLEAGTYYYNVTANDSSGNIGSTGTRTIRVLNSCLTSCVEGSSCAVSSDCILNNDLCSSGICTFENMTIGAKIYTIYDANGNGNNLTLNITSNSTRAPLRFLTGGAIISDGEAGADVTLLSRGSPVGNAGAVEISVSDLLNTTNANLSSRGGYTTWDSCPESWCNGADIDRNGRVSLNDLGLVGANWEGI